MIRFSIMYQEKLIAIYFFICEKYEKELKYQCMRFSNNAAPAFTDEEVLTIYFFAMIEERRFRINEIHSFAMRYLGSWFPKLPSYQAYNNRLNRLVNAVQALSVEILEQYIPLNCDMTKNLVDSFPIVTCSGKRQGKVADEITDKGYCSTKSMYYYGLKMHVLSYNREKTIPWPESIVLTKASESDLTTFKEYWGNWLDRNFFGDKIYNSEDWFENMEEKYGSKMYTPVKAVKGESEWYKQFNRAANDLFSKAVSTVRQPIESSFNWLIEKTDIQTASKVRSTKGLLLHVFGRIAAAFLYIALNP